MASLQLHEPDIACRLRVLINHSLPKRRPRRIANISIQLRVVRHLPLLFGCARDPVDVPDVVALSSKGYLVPVWRPAIHPTLPPIGCQLCRRPSVCRHNADVSVFAALHLKRDELAVGRPAGPAHRLAVECQLLKLSTLDRSDP